VQSSISAEEQAMKLAQPVAVLATFAVAATASPAAARAIDTDGRRLGTAHTRVTVRPRPIPFAWLCPHYPPQSFVRNGCA
jgi:hypothetical protein